MLLYFLITGHRESIPAHKYVLATGSPVFHAMFYGGLAEPRAEVDVPDVEPSAFLALLKSVLGTMRYKLLTSNFFSS